MSESDAALFRRPTSVMRNRCDVTDNREIEPDCLQCANRGFTASTRSLYPDFHFLKPVTHRLTRSVLRDELSSVCRAFARAFEAHFSCARPTDHFSGQVSDRDDRVVEGGKDVRNPGVNVLTSLCLDDLWLLVVRAIEREIFPRLFRRCRCSLLGFGSFLRRFGSSFRGGCSNSRSGGGRGSVSAEAGASAWAAGVSATGSFAFLAFGSSDFGLGVFFASAILIKPCQLLRPCF